MADGSGSHLTAAQRLELAAAIHDRALSRYSAGCVSVLRARQRVQRMAARLKRMEQELQRRAAQATDAEAGYCRVLLGDAA